MIGFLDGELGDPPGGWPEPFRTKALQGRTLRSRASPSSTDEQREPALRPRAAARTLNRLLFPGPTKEFADVARDATATCRCSHHATSSTGCEQGEEHEVEIEEGKRLILGLAGDRRAPTSAACAP